MATTQEILDQLNAYEATHDYSAVDAGKANNPWQDVILQLDDYDREATESLPDHSLASDEFALRDGTVIGFDHGAKRWMRQA
jgi:hypothetical protein